MNNNSQENIIRIYVYKEFNKINTLMVLDFLAYISFHKPLNCLIFLYFMKFIFYKIIFFKTCGLSSILS